MRRNFIEHNIENAFQVREGSPAKRNASRTSLAKSVDKTTPAKTSPFGNIWKKTVPEERKTEVRSIAVNLTSPPDEPLRESKSKNTKRPAKSPILKFPVQLKDAPNTALTASNKRIIVYNQPHKKHHLLREEKRPRKV